MCRCRVYENGNSDGGLPLTSRYSELNQHDALYTVARAYPGGIEALAQRMSCPERKVSPNTLRNKLRPSIDTHSASFEEVSTVLEFAEDARVVDAFAPLHAFCWRHGFVAVPLPAGAPDGDALMARVLGMIGDQGALVSTINEALADRVISHAELERIEAGLLACMSSLAAVREMVAAKHAVDSEGGRRG